MKKQEQKKQERRKRKTNGANGRRRMNNTGTLEKRGSKWLARWYIYTPQGKRIRKSQMLKADSIDQAREKLRDLTEGNALITREKMLERNRVEMEGVRAELQRVEDTKPALSLADMFDVFLSSPERPQKSGEDTLTMYESQAARFVAWMKRHHPDAKEMRQVSREVAAAFLDELGKTVSPNTYNKYLALLRLFWRILGEQARCVVNPWDKAQRKEQPKTNGRRALTVEELVRVTSNLDGEMRLLFALGIYTGLRLGDCATMEWGKIDLVRRIIVTTPRKTAKTGKEVAIPIHPVLASMLAETPKKKRTGYVLPTTAEAYLRDSAKITDMVKQIFEAAGITTQKEVAGYSKAVAEVGFHSLRHSFVSLMGNAGAPLALVQSIVGHSNPMMTAHYFHARTDALATAVGNLPALMAETEGQNIDADAPTSPAEREDGTGGATMPANAATRLEAFKAAFRALAAGERKAAAAWMATQEVC